MANRVAVEKMLFEDLDAGDQFVISASHGPKTCVAKKGSVLNVKTNEQCSSNAVCLKDGRPRTFEDYETVYKTSETGRF